MHLHDPNRSSDKYETKKQVYLFLPTTDFLEQTSQKPLVTLKTFHEHRKILGEEKRHTTNNETLELLFDLDSCFDYFSAFSVNRMEVKLNERFYFLQRCSSLPTALFYCSIVLLWLVIVQL